MRYSISQTAVAGLVALFAAGALGQAVPTDNDQWRNNCAAQIQSGAVPLPEGSGIPVSRLEELARDRSAHGQHFVACSIFIAAAGDESGAGNAQQSRNDLQLAKIEQKMGLGQKLSFVEKLTRSSDILAHVKDTAPPNTNEAFALSSLSQPGSPMGAPPAYGAPQTGAPGYAPAGGPPPNYGAPNGYPPPTQPFPQQGQYPGTQGQVSPPPSGYPPAGQGYPQNGQYQPQQGQTPQVQGSYPQQPYPAQPYGSPMQPQGSGPAYESSQPNQPSTSSPASAGASGQDSAGAPYGAPGQPLTSAASSSGTQASGTASAPSRRSRSSAATSKTPSHGAMPTGRYTCYTAPAVIANGGAYGDTIVSFGQWEGYMWIFDAHRYAGADINNTGTYVMQGDSIVPETGPYKRIETKMTYKAHGTYGRPTIYLSYIDNGQPSASMGCTHDEPSAK